MLIVGNRARARGSRVAVVLVAEGVTVDRV